MNVAESRISDYVRAWGEFNRLGPPSVWERWTTPRVRRTAVICALTIATVIQVALR